MGSRLDTAGDNQDPNVIISNYQPRRSENPRAGNSRISFKFFISCQVYNVNNMRKNKDLPIILFTSFQVKLAIIAFLFRNSRIASYNSCNVISSDVTHFVARLRRMWA